VGHHTVDLRWSVPRQLVWGGFCQGGAPRVLSIYFDLSFLVRPMKPVSSSRPHTDRQAGAHRSCQGWARSATPQGFVLDGSEHDGRLAVGRDDDVRGGSPRVVNELRSHPCMRWARDPDHDAVMRIAAKLRGGGPILYRGIKAMLSYGRPPPRTVIGDPSEAQGGRNRKVLR